MVEVREVALGEGQLALRIWGLKLGIGEWSTCKENLEEMLEG